MAQQLEERQFQSRASRARKNTAKKQAAERKAAEEQAILDMLEACRVEKVEQLGSDRIVVLTFGSGDYESHLVVELYDKGEPASLTHRHHPPPLLLCPCSI